MPLTNETGSPPTPKTGVPKPIPVGPKDLEWLSRMHACECGARPYFNEAGRLTMDHRYRIGSDGGKVHDIVANAGVGELPARGPRGFRPGGTSEHGRVASYRAVPQRDWLEKDSHAD